MILKAFPQHKTVTNDEYQHNFPPTKSETIQYFVPGNLLCQRSLLMRVPVQVHSCDQRWRRAQSSGRHAEAQLPRGPPLPAAPRRASRGRPLRLPPGRGGRSWGPAPGLPLHRPRGRQRVWQTGKNYETLFLLFLSLFCVNEGTLNFLVNTSNWRQKYLFRDHLLPPVGRLTIHGYLCF